MKKSILLSMAILCLFSCTNQNGNVTEMKKQLRHVVLFKFNEDATQDEIKNIEDAFIALPSKIAVVEDFEWGLNNSPEGLNKGFTHCFYVTFNSEKARDLYLPHPEHQAFVAILKPKLADVLVLDYWSK